MDYTKFACDEFVADSRFRQWVLQPNAASSSYWQSFLSKHPEKAEIIAQAAAQVRRLSEAGASVVPPVNEAEQDAIWQAVRAQVRITPANAGNSPLQSPFLGRYRPATFRWAAFRWVAAASVVLLASVGWWAWAVPTPETSNMARASVALPVVAATMTRENRSVAIRPVSLPDGSSVLLRRGSRIDFPAEFTDSNRIVYLTGEGFFEVAKDASRPFLVHANGVIAQAVGTSFTVRAYASDRSVVVTVRSGRVAVFTPVNRRAQRELAQHELAQPGTLIVAAVNAGLKADAVLTKNQQLVFDVDMLRRAKQAVLTPVGANAAFAAAPAAAFVFTAEPISAVFARLERAYGITISYDRQTLGNCRLTADLTDEPLAEKLLIVCKSIEADYRIDDTQISVTGPGCQL